MGFRFQIARHEAMVSANGCPLIEPVDLWLTHLCCGLCTSVVVYVPLLGFMYLCCGLCTSVGVCVPLLGFMYLCWGLCTSVVVYVPLLGFMYLLWGLSTCDREKVRGFRGWTEGSDTKSGGGRGREGGGGSQLSLAVLDDRPVSQFMRRREDGLRASHVLNDGRLAAVRLAHR